MGLLDHVSGAVGGGKHHGAKAGKEDQPPEGAAADDTEELDEESGNILVSLIGQLRIGMDLSKVTLPTFVLEPRSMLERITVSQRQLICCHVKSSNTLLLRLCSPPPAGFYEPS
jgi:hypothetical protein